MSQYFDDAVEEVKRVDHLVYVSLKYTRTVDVIRSVLGRIISTFDCAIDALLEHLKQKKMIAIIPTNPAVKLATLEKHFKDDQEMLNYLSFYGHVRKLIRAEYKAREEYRRHVTMI